MADGEAAFDVAHDPTRAFLIAVGDRQVRVVGTEFNLRRREGLTALTVRRGVVEVRPAGAPDAAPTRLVPRGRAQGLVRPCQRSAPGDAQRGHGERLAGGVERCQAKPRQSFPESFAIVEREGEVSTFARPPGMLEDQREAYRRYVGGR